MDDMPLIDSFLTFKQVNGGRSARTAQVYRLALTRLVEFMGARGLLDATQDDLLAFSGPHLHKMGLSPSSRHPHIVAVKEFYKWLSSTRQMPASPAASLPYPKIGRTLQRVMTLKNAERLIWSPDVSTFEGVRDSAMLLLLIGCGLRVSGLVDLNESNLIEDEADGEARLLLRVTEKGDKARKLSIPRDADLMLRMYLAHEELRGIDRRLPNGDKVLFVSVRNRTVPACDYSGEARRLNRRAVLEMVKKYGQRVGIPEDQIHPHAMRHLYGTELAEGEVDLLVRQRLMGHADPKSTAIYTSMALRKLTRENDKHNPLAKMRTPVGDLLKRLDAKKGG
jgi:site-specific recombinase XerD